MRSLLKAERALLKNLPLGSLRSFVVDRAAQEGAVKIGIVGALASKKRDFCANFLADAIDPEVRNAKKDRQPVGLSVVRNRLIFRGVISSGAL